VVLPDAETPSDVPRLLIDLARLFELELDHTLLTTLAPEQRLAYVLEQAQHSHMMPLDLDLAQIRQLFNVYKANTCALYSYIVRPYHGRVTLFRASDALEEPDPALGWSTCATDGVELYVVPGNHQYDS
jgi:hypothetical protein